MPNMPKSRRFFLLSSLLCLVLFLITLGLLNTKPTVAYAFADTPAATATEPVGDPARGKFLVQLANCALCHSSPKLVAADKTVPLAGGNEFKLGQIGTFYALNLTQLQGWGFAEFDEALRQGIEPYTGRVLAPIMPYHTFHTLSDTDVASIGDYLMSLTPVDNTIPQPQLGPAFAALKPLPAQSIPAVPSDTSVANGAYLAETVINCAQCHSPHDSSGAVIKGRDLSGGTRNFGSTAAPFFAPAILGPVLTAEGYTVDNFVAVFRTGVRPRGVPLAPQMPWRRFGIMPTSDLTAIWNYLQTKKMDSPWPVQTALPTRAATPPATPSLDIAAPTSAATAAQ